MYDNRIVVRNSCIKIKNYTLGECPALENNFKVWNPVTHSMDILGMYYDEKEEALYLPRGIDIWKIKKYLDEKYHTVEKSNDYSYINNILIKYSPRDEEQKEALRFMCGVNEYEDNRQLPQLSVNLSTGKGKTYCSIATIAYFKIKSVVITASTTLLNQWKDKIKEYTNLTDKDILQISGSPMMNMIINDKSQRARNASIYLVTHGTIRSFGDNYGWDKLNLVFDTLGIGIKFIDEAHQNFNNMLMLDFFTNITKTYYITATPKRSDYREDRIYQLSLKNVPNIDLFDEDNDPHTDYIAIKWNSRPTAMQISECRNFSYGLDRNKYVNYVVNQPNFYKMLYIIMDMVIKCKGRVLFYIGTNDAILKVYKWMGDNYPEFIGDVGIYTSLMSKEDKLIEREKKLILTTTKSAGAGEDISNLKMTIVLAEPFKSEVLARQSLGRTRNKDTIYVELVDMGFTYLRRYYQEKLKVFNQYAKSTTDTVIDQYELDRRSEKLEEQRFNKIALSPIKFRDERFFDYSQEDYKNKDKKEIVKPIFFLK